MFRCCYLVWVRRVIMLVGRVASNDWKGIIYSGFFKQGMFKFALLTLSASIFLDFVEVICLLLCRSVLFKIISYSRLCVVVFFSIIF